MVTTLSAVSPGVAVEITAVPDPTARAKLLRLGFLDGPVECRRRLRKGPVVLRRHGTELAIGAPLADRIEVTPP